MGALLLLALIADAIVLAASQFRSYSLALQVCNVTINLCDHPVPLLVAGVILGGVFLVQR
jgi:hypothetical protein